MVQLSLACGCRMALRGGLGNSDRVLSYSRLIERRDFMGKVTRKRYGADFKAKVALEAIRRWRNCPPNMGAGAWIPIGLQV